MRKFKNILSFIISLLLTLVFLANIFFVFFKLTVFNSDLYLKLSENNKGIKYIYESINNDINYLLLSNNIPQDTLTDIITMDDIDNEVNSTITSIISFLDGREMEENVLNTDPYLEKFDIKINDFLSKNSITMTDNLKNDIKDIRTSVNDIITSELQIIDLNKLVNSTSGNKVKNIISILNNKTTSIILFGTDIVLIALLILIWGKRKLYRPILWTGYSAVASGLIVFLISVSGYLSHFYDSLIIGIPYLKNLIVEIIKAYLKSLTLTSSFFIILGVILLVIYFIHFKNKIKNC